MGNGIDLSPRYKDGLKAMIKRHSVGRFIPEQPPVTDLTCITSRHSEIVSTGLITRLTVGMAMVEYLIPDGLWEWFRWRRYDRNVGDDTDMGAGRCWRPRPAVRDGNCRRASVRPGRPHTGGSPSGAGLGYGASSTVCCWMSSAHVAD